MAEARGRGRAAGTPPPGLPEAVQAHQRGDLAEAERGYRGVLARDARQPDALNLLGVLTLQRGQAPEAERLIRQAIAARPRQATFHNNLGEALRAAGDAGGALAAYREAVRLAPDYAQAWVNLATTQGDAGDLDGAARSAARAARLAPRAPEVLAAQGMVAQARGDLDAALRHFRAALAAAPRHLPSLANLAGALAAAGRAAEAAEHTARLCELAPREPHAWWMLAEHRRAAGDAEGAEQAARRALELAPGVLEPLLSLEAALRAQGRIEESAACLRQALALDPQRAAIHNNLGMSLMALGETAEAAGCFERALELAPDLAAAWENLARSRRFAGPEASARAQQVETRLGAAADAPRAVAHLRFAAARWRDDAGDVDAAVEHYREANRAARRLRQWDADAHSALVDALIETFDAALFEGVAATPPAPAEDAALPLLVVGMPRSGTTLVEQILASHPAVHGAGELNLLAGYVERMPATLDGTPWPRCARLLDAPKRADLARVYCERLRALAPPAARVTDKMPSNFLHLGLLALMLPGARVVHCVRDARDTALSILMHHFEGGHAWAYDVGEISRYHADYLRLMAHWRRVLPLDIRDVVYEELVARPEPAIRALVAWTGLDWDDACLAPELTRRTVRTASQAQVREPINRRSVGRWRRWAGLLEGFEPAGNVEAR